MEPLAAQTASQTRTKSPAPTVRETRTPRRGYVHVAPVPRRRAPAGLGQVVGQESTNAQGDSHANIRLQVSSSYHLPLLGPDVRDYSQLCGPSPRPRERTCPTDDPANAVRNRRCGTHRWIHSGWKVLRPLQSSGFRSYPSDARLAGTPPNYRPEYIPEKRYRRNNPSLVPCAGKRSHPSGAAGDGPIHIRNRSRSLRRGPPPGRRILCRHTIANCNTSRRRNELRSKK
jgi:hypothetical protein